MNPRQVPLTFEQHVNTAIDNLRQAQDLKDRDWFAVVLFYTVHQFLRAALLVDPRFDGCTALPNGVVPTDALRRPDSHKTPAGKPITRLGMFDLVRFIYPKAYASFHLLFQASCEVRYGTGLIAPAGEPEGIVGYRRALWAAFWRVVEVVADCCRERGLGDAHQEILQLYLGLKGRVAP